MSDVLDLTLELLRRVSVTPNDAGCQALLATRLRRAGVHCQTMHFGEVDNLWACHGAGGPVLVFLGHTDVVSSGPEADWSSPPFEPVIRDGSLYGRGAADMKGAVAAMTLAIEDFVAAYPQHPGTVALLLTSDEEGPARDGVRRIAEQFRRSGQGIDWCVVGEASSHERLGDLIRIGRRGSLTGKLRIHGIQGHVAYPEQARNPVHAFSAVLAELLAERWDEGDGDSDFPPTSLQFSNLHAGAGADNIIPGSLDAVFNFRYSTASTAASLRDRVEAILQQHELEYELEWHHSGEPFLTQDGLLRRAARDVLEQQLGRVPDEDTGGGTSDGRFIAPLGAEVIELGPVNASIHKVDEHIAIADLEQLPGLYHALAERLLVS